MHRSQLASSVSNSQTWKDSKPEGVWGSPTPQSCHISTFTFPHPHHHHHHTHTHTRAHTCNPIFQAPFYNPCSPFKIPPLLITGKGHLQEILLVSDCDLRIHPFYTPLDLSLHCLHLESSTPLQNWYKILPDQNGCVSYPLCTAENGYKKCKSMKNHTNCVQWNYF